jgi:hypothetical protein
MSSKFFILPTSQTRKNQGMKEIILSIDNTSLIIPCADEWDLGEKIIRHDRKIKNLLLERHPGKF